MRRVSPPRGAPHLRVTGGSQGAMSQRAWRQSPGQTTSSSRLVQLRRCPTDLWGTAPDIGTPRDSSCSATCAPRATDLQVANRRSYPAYAAFEPGNVLKKPWKVVTAVCSFSRGRLGKALIDAPNNSDGFGSDSRGFWAPGQPTWLNMSSTCWRTHEGLGS
jgi:hypothetical protein